MPELELSDRWSGHADSTSHAETRRARVLAELSTEIGRGHELFGQVVRVEAFFEASDDVVVRLTDGTFALVHPTCSGKPERPPWPAAQRLGSGAEASAAVAQWEERW
jgi:hypothetical protein